MVGRQFRIVPTGSRFLRKIGDDAVEVPFGIIRKDHRDRHILTDNAFERYVIIFGKQGEVKVEQPRQALGPAQPAQQQDILAERRVDGHRFFILGVCHESLRSGS